MFTETELRSALDHSAGRADHIGVSDVLAGTIASHRRRWLPPVAAVAATVIAATVLGLSIGHGSDHPSAAPGTTTTTLDLSGLVDAAQAKSGDRDLAARGIDAGTERISSTATHDRTTVVWILRPSSAFDPSRIDRSRPISIAGTTGYFTQLASYPLLGTDDDDLPGSAIVFPRPNGTWVVVSVPKLPEPSTPPATVNVPAEIVTAYDQMGVTFADDASLLPVKIGYLPPGARLTALDFHQFGSVSEPLLQAFIRISVDGHDYVIEISPSEHPAGEQHVCVPSAGCEPDLTRSENGLEVSVSGDDKAVARQIFNSAAFADSATDTATWFPLSQALG